MKYENPKKKIEEFWIWFQSIADTLARDVENTPLLRELDDRLSKLNPKLSWEIGPGLSKPWQLVISPNLNRDLRETARAIVAAAPGVSLWEFHPSRQAKQWDYKLELQNAEGSSTSLDVSGWTFVLLRYPDGAHEILLKGKDLPDLKPDQRWQAAAITLESILGEDVILDRIDDFELVDQLAPDFARKERPVQHLRDALGAA